MPLLLRLYRPFRCATNLTPPSPTLLPLPLRPLLLPAAVADQYMPANMEYFSPQQLQIAVKAWNKLGFSSPAVAAAAVRLSEVLPHLAPDFPDGIAAAAAMQP